MKKSIFLMCFIMILATVVFTGCDETIILEKRIGLTTKEGTAFVKFNSSSLEIDGSDTFDNYIEVDTSGVVTLRTTKSIQIQDRELPAASRQLSDDELNGLYELIDDKRMLRMDHDISTDSCDGSYVIMTFYLEDGSEYSVGGLNPDNRRFDAVADYIGSLITDEMQLELDDKCMTYYEDLDSQILYSTYYLDITTYGLDVTEAQLETIDADNFFSDIKYLTERHYYTNGGQYDKATASLIEEGYSIFCFYDYIEVYIGESLVGTVDMMDYMILCADDIEGTGVDVTEDLLRSIVPRDLFNDIFRICDEGNYFYVIAAFDYDEMCFTGEGYSIIKDGEEWKISIGTTVIGALKYISVADFYAEQIDAYHVTLSDEELCMYNLTDMFFYVEELITGENISTYDMTYDEANDLYTYVGKDTCAFSFDGDGSGTYEILYDDVVIGNFKVK